MSPTVHSSPYRSACAPAVAPRPGRASLRDRAQQLACEVLLGWAVLRLALCAVRGLDAQGVVALLIVVTAANTLFERSSA